MSLKSVYLPSPLLEEGWIRIAGDEHRHLAVSRTEPGETLEIFDGRGGVWTAVVDRISKRETVLRVTATRNIPPEPYELVLGQSLIRTAAFEFALEKAVEVGVTRIIPLVAGRSNVTAGKRADRWTRILVEAAKQSKRYHLPVLDDPTTFEQILHFKASSRILFAERGGGPLKSALSGWPVLYLIGPEGGWTDSEMDASRACGFAHVGLGSGILKSETAAIVGGALIRYELG